MEICGHTYANKTLKRYDTENYAEPVKAATLSALADYIVNCRDEFTKGGKMIIHVVSPTRVRLMSVLVRNVREKFYLKRKHRLRSSVLTSGMTRKLL